MRLSLNFDRQVMGKIMRCAVVVLLACLGLPAAVGAQEVAQDVGRAVPVGGTVSEGFDPTARVAGSRVVGVAFRSAQGLAFDPEQIRIVGASPSATICVRAISRDGLYWMRTPYEPGIGASLLLTPFTQLPDRLRSYGADEIAIYAFETAASPAPPSAESRAADCLAARDDAVTILPVTSGPVATDQLLILVNSGNRKVEGQIVGQTTVGLRCAAPDSAERIAYDRVCSATVDPDALGTGQVTLNLVFDDGLTKTRLDYRMRLAGGGP